MKLPTSLAVVALATAAFAPAAPAAAYDSSTSGIVTVRVVSAVDGMPVERVPVQLSASGSVVDGMTDKSGVVRFDGVQSGIASVETAERAIGSCSQTVSVRKGGATEITIRLRPQTAFGIAAWAPNSSACGS